MFASLGLIAQQQDYVLRSETNLVMLDVAVTGRGAAPIAGLTKNQFTLYEDGKRQEIKHFSAGEMPVTMGLVVDMSGSMFPKLEGVYRAVSALLSASNPSDEFFLVGFNDKPRLALNPERSFTKNPLEIQSALRTFRAIGRTALYDGLAMGIDHIEGGTYPRRVLIVVSDGKDTGSRLSLEDAVSKTRSSPITVYTVGIWEEYDENQNAGVLRRLANVTGGRFYHPLTPGQLRENCVAIAKDIRARYTLAYIPSPVGKSAIRRIRVEVEGNGRVRTRSEYFMPAQ